MNLKMTIIFFSKTPDKSITQIEICFRTERQKKSCINVQGIVIISFKKCQSQKKNITAAADVFFLFSNERVQNNLSLLPSKVLVTKYCIQIKGTTEDGI